eukprot:scaffold413_cov176-Ochromonas_danica.AAC.11
MRCGQLMKPSARRRSRVGKRTRISILLPKESLSLLMMSILAVRPTAPPSPAQKAELWAMLRKMHKVRNNCLEDKRAR